MTANFRVLMFGPGLQATSGITNVVNNWFDAGINERINLTYISTLDNYVPGHYLRKFFNAIRAYFFLIKVGLQDTDLVHIHLSHGMSFYRKLIIFEYATRMGVKTVVHLHGSCFQEFYASGTPLRKKLIQSMFNRASGVLVLSKAWKKFIQSISNNNSVYIIYNGGSVEKFGEQLDQQDKVIIAFMGRLGQRKGIYDLLEAFHRLCKVHTSSELLLGGDGEIEQVKAVIKKKNLESRVKVLGWVSGQEKINVFRKASIYVLPSYNEGLPGSVLEAMAASTAIVSTPVGGIPEAVIEGKNGFLVNPGDIDALYSRLLKLCNDKVLRKAMGNESKEILGQKFNIYKIIDELICTYQKILITTAENN